MAKIKKTLNTTRLILALGMVTSGVACSGNKDNGPRGADGPPNSDVNPNVHEVGNAANGRDVFRFETFGNEGFWTDAAKLPAGMIAANFTPLKALDAGYHVNIEALSPSTQAALAAELMTDLSPGAAPMLNDVQTTVALINSNAIIGVVARDTNMDSFLTITGGDKVGVSCALCHAITDGSAYMRPNGGSIGIEVDGPTPHTLNVGATFAIAENTRALYPIAQLALTANGGATIGRAPTGLTEASSEAAFDAYFSNPAFYPIGMFDDAVDGNGAPMHITPMFRADLGAPWGSEGAISKLDNFANLVYTALLDPTMITTTGGRAFLNTLGGAAGDEIVEDYVQVLADTNVTGYPFLDQTSFTSTMPGTEPGPLGVRVDNQKLLDMNAYLNSLPAPAGSVEDEDAVARGRAMFRESCTSCHNVDQSKFVPPMIIPMIEIFPGDDPVILAQRNPPLNPIQNTVDSIFDDKMVVVNASIRGLERGTALPLLLDLARKPVFLHDNSVPTLDDLLDPSRGALEPHPFYIEDQDERDDMIAFLRSLSTD